MIIAHKASNSSTYKSYKINRRHQLFSNSYGTPMALSVIPTSFFLLAIFTLTTVNVCYSSNDSTQQGYSSFKQKFYEGLAVKRAVLLNRFSETKVS